MNIVQPWPFGSFSACWTSHLRPPVALHGKRACHLTEDRYFLPSNYRRISLEARFLLSSRPMTNRTEFHVRYRRCRQVVKNGLLLVGLTYLAAAQTVAPLTSFGHSEDVIVCNEVNRCTSEFINGLHFRELSSNGLLVAASAISSEGQYPGVLISVRNDTGKPLDVLPDEFTFDVFEPKRRTLRRIIPEQVAHSSGQGRWYSSIMKNALKENTLAPGQVLAGIVYFERIKKVKKSTLNVTISGTTFQFPL